MKDDKNNIAFHIKNTFERNTYGDGTIERMQARIDALENAVSHLVAFLADKLRLTEDEIHNENGITDF